MARKKHTPEQIIGKLREIEVGLAMSARTLVGFLDKPTVL